MQTLHMPRLHKVEAYISHSANCWAVTRNI
jgi:hypothetical protein